MEARYSGILELVEKEEYAESRLLWRWSMLLEDLECNRHMRKEKRMFIWGYGLNGDNPYNLLFHVATNSNTYYYVEAP